jgi:predicted DNA-binding protein YlxM (UPF0122 family)
MRQARLTPVDPRRQLSRRERRRPGAGILCQGLTLSSLDSRQRQVELFERYAPLLTEQQREVLELHLRSDWSLSEIAGSRDTSRAAVHDMIHRATQAMEGYESRLGLLLADSRRREVRNAVALELADIRRRLVRVEQEVART